jgi:cyclopropane fatty-acyl-phospholipid synthase-like methyltransferase
VDGLPFSQAAENNREAILEQLRGLLEDSRSVLEVGAGTGQHAVHFAAALPQLRWQPSEQPSALATLRLRCEAAAIDNLEQPVALDICEGPWPRPWPDALYTANTLHIVARDQVKALFAACADRAMSGSRLIVYGPFNYAGRYTSESNANFDQWLKDRDPQSAIRDFEWVDELAQAAGYTLYDDIAMPANNRLLCWQRD